VLGFFAALSLLAHPAVTVAPQSSWVDQPVAIRVSGLPRRALATVRLSAKDATGKTWHSSARLRADAHGTVNLTGPRSWGLLASLTRRTAAAAPVVFRWGVKERTMRLTVQVRGKTVARGSFRRGLPHGVNEQTLTLAGTGVYGEYYAAASSARSPAVLIFGGSEGGLTVGLRAELLAAHGFPSLAIAYFGEPGLPPALASVPLEYFRRALEWLAAQTGVDPQKIAAIGISRGGEAAQLLGVHYPDLVHAVVAASASNAVVCGFPDCSKPAWTLNGAPIPYVAGAPVPEPEGEGVIPDETVRGPLFLTCGERDVIWLSCPYERAIMERLRRFHHPYADELHAYPKAGHYVGGLMPGLPVAPSPYFDANTERARQDLWPKLLAFLGRL
jgi:pimeloyl-ACP methyl ester carboxylesterase